MGRPAPRSGRRPGCGPAKNPDSPGKYIELRISLSDPPDTVRLQAALQELMKEFMAFAQSKLRCPGGSARQ
ncbi:hypothetical protein GCM10017562_52740 [Streptomyces roseofulvus]